MAERKKFHCGDRYCTICNTLKEVHKNQVEFSREINKKWQKEFELEEKYRQQFLEAEREKGFWRRLIDALF